MSFIQVSVVPFEMQQRYGIFLGGAKNAILRTYQQVIKD